MFLQNAELEQTWVMDSFQSISQTIDSEKDPLKNCVNYPNIDYEAFGDCDLYTFHQDLKNEYDGIMPFWATTNYSTVTKLR